jgi:hypothetical protein
MQDHTHTNDDDYAKIVWGAGPIGQVVGLSERQARHALETGLLDADKHGSRWASSVGRLLAPFRKRRASTADEGRSEVFADDQDQAVVEAKDRIDGALSLLACSI